MKIIKLQADAATLASFETVTPTPAGSELIPLETMTGESIFGPGGADTIFAQIAEKARAFTADTSTKAGREVIASQAYKVAKVKVALDGMKKALTEEWRTQTKRVNEEGKALWDRLEALQAEVRAPLNAWEAAEAARCADHQEALAAIRNLIVFETPEPASTDVRERLDVAERRGNRDWQEYAEEAAQARADAIDTLSAMFTAAQQREADAAELAQLRAERAAREAREAQEAADRAEAERVAQIAEQARIAAEEAAKREIEAAAQRVRDAEDAVYRAEKAAADAAAKAEADRIAAEAKAKQDKADAIAAEQARAARVDAERLAAEEAKRREDEKKAANTRHRASVNSKAAAQFVAYGFDDEKAREIVVLIAKGAIPAVFIQY